MLQALGFDRDSSRRVWVTTFCTCNGSIRRDAFLAVGGFDENFTGNSYGDDYDLAIRLDAAGYRIVFDPEAALVHLRVPVGGLRLSDSANSFNEFDRALSSWIFVLRHGRGRMPSLLYRHLLRKTVLMKRNVVRPWRQPAVWAGLIRAYFEARRRVQAGPRSRFTQAAAPLQQERIGDRRDQMKNGLKRAVKDFVKGALRKAGFQYQWNPQVLFEKPEARLEISLPMACAYHALRHKNCRYVHIGAFDGITGDPLGTFTKDLGWEGILVEPQPHRFAAIAKKSGGQLPAAFRERGHRPQQPAPPRCTRSATT